MKKSFLFLGLASVMAAFTACSTDDIDAVAGGREQTSRMELKAVMPASATRTQMGENSALWSEGDRIALFTDGPVNNWLAFDVASGAGTASATFTVDAMYADAWENLDITPKSVPYPSEYRIAAVYPYDNAIAEDPSGSGYQSLGQIGARIPKVQNYVKGSFDKNALPMIALTTTTQSFDSFTPLQFLYMGSVLKFQVGSDEAVTIDKIELSSSSVSIASEVAVEFMPSYMNAAVVSALDTGAGTLGSVGAGFVIRTTPDAASETITMNGPIEVEAGSLTDVYFVVVPWAYDEQGANFTVRFYKEGVDEPVVRTISAHDLKAGDVAEVAALYLSEGDVPELSKSGEEVISWTAPSQTVKSYTWTITEDDEILRSGALEGTATEFDLKNVELQLSAGSHTLAFNMTVEYANYMSVACAPVEFERTALGFEPTVTYSEGKLTVTNWDELKSEANGTPEVEYASVNTLDAGEEAFADASFTELTEATLDLSALAPGDYTYMVRADYGGEYLSDIVSFSVADPSENPLTVSYDYQEGILTVTVLTGKELCVEAFDAWSGYVKFDDGSEFPTSVTPVVGSTSEDWNPETGVITIDINQYNGWGTILKGTEYKVSLILEDPNAWGVVEYQTDPVPMTFD